MGKKVAPNSVCSEPRLPTKMSEIVHQKSFNPLTMGTVLDSCLPNLSLQGCDYPLETVNKIGLAHVVCRSG